MNVSWVLVQSGLQTPVVSLLTQQIFSCWCVKYLGDVCACHLLEVVLQGLDVKLMLQLAVPRDLRMWNMDFYSEPSKSARVGDVLTTHPPRRPWWRISTSLYVLPSGSTWPLTGLFRDCFSKGADYQQQIYFSGPEIFWYCCKYLHPNLRLD